jgi:hypothetical protein
VLAFELLPFGLTLIGLCHFKKLVIRLPRVQNKQIVTRIIELRDQMDLGFFRSELKKLKLLLIKLPSFNYPYYCPLQPKFIFGLNILQSSQFRQYLGAVAAGLYA